MANLLVRDATRAASRVNMALLLALVVAACGDAGAPPPAAPIDGADAHDADGTREDTDALSSDASHLDDAPDTEPDDARSADDASTDAIFDAVPDTTFDAADASQDVPVPTESMASRVGVGHPPLTASSARFRVQVGHYFNGELRSTRFTVRPSQISRMEAE